MTSILADLDHIVLEKMIIFKIIYSLLPSYNSTISAQPNVQEILQTINNLKEYLLCQKSLIQKQGVGSYEINYAFFIQSLAILSYLHKKKE